MNVYEFDEASSVFRVVPMYEFLYLEGFLLFNQSSKWSSGQMNSFLCTCF